MISTKSFRSGAGSSSITDDALEKARDLRLGVQDIANRGISVVSDSAVAAQQRLGQYAGATGRYVSEQPVKSALIAAAVGAAVAALVLAARRRRNYYY